MNRRERRKLEKDLGIIKHKQKMNISQRLKSIREGVETGREKLLDSKEKRRRQENEEADKQASSELSSLATTLMLRDNLSWYEATEAAKRESEAKNVQKSEAT